MSEGRDQIMFRAGFIAPDMASSGGSMLPIPEANPSPSPRPQSVRSIFLSDIHLGTRACQADQLLGFLRAYESEHLFLLGDIIDFWGMSRGVYWSSAQNTVIQKILKRARHGGKVVYVPGNHDEVAREHVGTSFGNIRVLHDCVHVGADGTRYLLLHGDEFDQVTRYHKWLALLGDRAYAFMVRLNVMLSWFRRTLGIPGYWSLAGYAKRKVKKALTFIYDFEESVVRHARERRVDGVICGHIHAATIREIDGMCYVNCGDWVDSCTAIVEHHDGRLELIRWSNDTNDPVAAMQADETSTSQSSRKTELQ
ncbi:MAG TPA: UDP-2,3-diacylglucosamine diphosphatase [Burkholderiales bacterium]|nr:UDP-2,3-diacylglucosamine diphosphatase [Burkholderiales bacterium]